MIRTSRSTRRPHRPGFTLVELMVAAAVCVIIMAVMATAFQMGIDTMRQMRSAGDMTDQLRAAGEVMKRDLQTAHFLPSEGLTSGSGRRLSDYRFDQSPAPTVSGGFFRIDGAGSVDEGYDSNSLQSTRATNHGLHFTSVLPGGNEQNLFTTLAPAGTGKLYSSQAAEIAYFLDPPTSTVYANADTNVPLRNLVRRQRLVAMSESDQFNLQQAVTADPNAADVISVPQGGGQVNTMATLATVPPAPAASPRMNKAALSGARYGDDILLSNVISFEVKTHWYHPNNQPRPFTQNTDAPYDNLTFDTASNPSVRVLAVQVRVRVFDPKMKSARQATYIIDL